VLKPAREKARIGNAALAPLDRFLETQRNWVVGITLAVTILGLSLLAQLRFDLNPLDLRSPKVESVSTLLDLMRDPDTSPNTMPADIADDVLARRKIVHQRRCGRIGGFGRRCIDDGDDLVGPLWEGSIEPDLLLAPGQVA